MERTSSIHCQDLASSAWWWRGTIETAANLGRDVLERIGGVDSESDEDNMRFGV